MKYAALVDLVVSLINLPYDGLISQRNECLAGSLK